MRLRRKNRKIRARNQRRAEWAALLQSSDFGDGPGAAALESVPADSSELTEKKGLRASLRRKLRAARGFGRRLRRVGTDTAIECVVVVGGGGGQFNAASGQP